MTKFINIDGLRIHTDLINTYQASYDSGTQESTIIIELEEDQTSTGGILTMHFENCGLRDEFLSHIDQVLGTKIGRLGPNQKLVV